MSAPRAVARLAQATRAAVRPQLAVRPAALRAAASRSFSTSHTASQASELLLFHSQALVCCA